MDIINQVISSLSKDEIRLFKIFAGRLNVSSDRKDFQLLDYIRTSGEKYIEDKISAKLYGDSNKDSFYKLKSRLLDYLVDFLTFHNIRKSDTNELLRCLSAFHIFLRKNQLPAALLYLKKAETKAKSTEHFEILDQVYSHFVKLSADMPEINPEEYIVRWKENAIRLDKIRSADMAIATLSYRLKTTQNMVPGKSDALQILNNTIFEFAGDDSVKNSKSFQTRAFRAVSQVLLQKYDYVALEKYVVEIFRRFEKEKWFDEGNHEIKLQMLTYLINALFINRRFKESLEYASTLGNEIKAYNKLLYDKYLFFYYNSLVINYSALDKKKALITLEQFEKEIKHKKNSYYDQFLYYNKALLLHKLGNPSEAVRNIVRLYTNDNYSNANDTFKLKVSVTELMMQFDAGDITSYQLRSKAVKIQFSTAFSTGDFIQEFDLIRLMDKMATKPLYKLDAKLKKQADIYVGKWTGVSKNESEVTSYPHWLATKWGWAM